MLIALLGDWLLTLDHEILAHARAVLKQMVPALRNDHTTAAYLQNVDLMHVLGKGDRLGQPDRRPRLLVNIVERVRATSYHPL